MSTAVAARDNEAQILAKACINAGKALGITQVDLGRIIGRDRSTLQRYGVEPHTSNGQLALLLVRCYRSLYALMGGDLEHIRHWMHTLNHHTGGVPAQQLQSVTGLVKVCEYLDAIRGKV